MSKVWTTTWTLKVRLVLRFEQSATTHCSYQRCSTSLSVSTATSVEFDTGKSRHQRVAVEEAAAAVALVSNPPPVRSSHRPLSRTSGTNAATPTSAKQPSFAIKFRTDRRATLLSTTRTSTLVYSFSLTVSPSATLTSHCSPNCSFTLPTKFPLIWLGRRSNWSLIISTKFSTFTSKRTTQSISGTSLAATITVAEMQRKLKN